MQRLLINPIISIFLVLLVSGCADVVDDVSTKPIKPTANAGADITIKAGVPYTLDASGSNSLKPLTYQWSIISEPTDLSLLPENTPMTMTVNLNAPIVTVETEWVIELTINDGFYSETDMLTITVLPDSAVPSIVNQLPEQGALNVSTNTVIEMQFDEQLKETAVLLSDSIKLSSITSAGGVKNHTGTIVYLANENKLVLSLSEPLINDTIHTVTLSSDIEDYAGNKRDPQQWKFTTVKNNNSSLSDVQVTGSSLNPIFQFDKTSYVANIGFLQLTTDITVATVDDNATFTINGISTISGQIYEIDLAPGDNLIDIAVTAADSTTQLIYNIQLVRQSANDFAEAYVKAGDTSAGDLFGVSVALSGDTLAVGAPSEDSNAKGVNCSGVDLIGGTNGAGNGIPDCREDSSLTSSGAVYVFIRQNNIWSQQAYIKAGDPEVGDGFGFSVALSGDTLVVGAGGEDSGSRGINCDNGDTNNNGVPDCREDTLTSIIDSGAVYVFTRNNNIWSQQAYIKAADAAAGDSFGGVALSGDTLAVGATKESSNAIGVNCIGVDTNANGIPDCREDTSAGSSGAVYVFTRLNNVWSQRAYIKADGTMPMGLAYFGGSLALSGDTLAVGARFEHSSLSTTGAVYMFIRTNGVWSQQAHFRADDTDANDYFGSSVDLSGDTLVVGATGEDSSATGVNCDDGDANSNGIPDCREDASLVGSGVVYVFIRQSNIWSQQAYIKAGDTEESDYFGSSVALSGNILAVGAYAEDSSARGVNCSSEDLIGGAGGVGNGIPDCREDTISTDSGAVYMFTRRNNIWSQEAYIKADDNEIRDNFGNKVALSGDTLVVGAYAEDSSARGVNCSSEDLIGGINGTGNGISDCREDTSLLSSGAAYIFGGNQ